MFYRLLIFSVCSVQKTGTIALDDEQGGLFYSEGPHGTLHKWREDLKKNKKKEKKDKKKLNGPVMYRIECKIFLAVVGAAYMAIF